MFITGGQDARGKCRTLGRNRLAEYVMIRRGSFLPNGLEFRRVCCAGFIVLHLGVDLAVPSACSAHVVAQICVLVKCQESCALDRGQLFDLPFGFPTPLSPLADVMESYELSANHNDSVTPAEIFRGLHVNVRVYCSRSEHGVWRRLNGTCCCDRRQYARKDGV